MKVCNNCLESKEESSFNKNKKMKDGLLNQCKECRKIKVKNYKNLNKDKLKEKRKKYDLKNYEKIKKRVKRYQENYYIENREKILEYQKNYRNQNLEEKKVYERNYRCKNKQKKLAYHSNKMKTDILYSMKYRIRDLIRKSLSSKGFSKKSKTEEILGCTFIEFKIYLESKFEHWMTWENKGLYNGEFNFGWDIDHIIPLCSGKTEEDIIKLNHHSNLQPLCSKINRDIKRNNI